MIFHGRFEPDAALQAQEPDAQTEVETLLQHRLQEHIAGRLVDLPVNPLIEAHQVVDVACVDGRQLAHQRLHQRPVAGAGALGRQPGRVSLHLDAHLGEPVEVGQIDVRDEASAVGDEADQVLVRQALERLPDRGPSQAQLLPQTSLLDHRARRQLERDDLVSY